jgi:hypothetical protein
MPDTPVIFENVRVLSSTDLAIRCLVGGKVVIVGAAQPLPGTTIRRPGDVGRLVLPRGAVRDLGLTEPAD